MPVNFRETKETSDARMISVALVQQLLDDIAFCKAAIAELRGLPRTSPAGRRGASTSGMPWLYVTGGGLNDEQIGQYLVDVYPEPNLDADPLAEDVDAKNSFEFGNTGSRAGGYDINPLGSCPEIIGLVPAPSEKWYRAEDFLKVDGDWVWVFHHRNDPEIGPA